MPLPASCDPDPTSAPSNSSTSSPGAIASSRSPFKKAFASFSRSSGTATAHALKYSSSSASLRPSATHHSSTPPESSNLQLRVPATTPTMPPHDATLPKAAVSRTSSTAVSEAESSEHVKVDGNHGANNQAAEQSDQQDDSPLQKAINNPNHRPLPGHPGNLTPSQTEALLELTKQLQLDGALHDPDKQPPVYQETQLLRFLRARNFDVQAARTMYLKAEEWKKKVDLDRLVDEWVFDEEEEVAKSGWKMCE
ncbi:cytosolic factor, phosphatidylinositol/phosphatidylcholine transfer protein [Thecaphora frezii]